MGEHAISPSSRGTSSRSTQAREVEELRNELAAEREERLRLQTQLQEERENWRKEREEDREKQLMLESSMKDMQSMMTGFFSKFNQVDVEKVFASLSATGGKKVNTDLC